MYFDRLLPTIWGGGGSVVFLFRQIDTYGSEELAASICMAKDSSCNLLHYQHVGGTWFLRLYGRRVALDCYQRFGETAFIVSIEERLYSLINRYKHFGGSY
jgi:hypothetical protein